ncbi:hypothetical protein CR969_01025 [Candidatus Saccharibacteria bacterium]|nr:MAG: hypothetical protein CR969_01025 [Candidatus Saccharibacteria bacterium]
MRLPNISRFWLRRLCEAGLFVSLSILVVYAWARFVPTGYRLPIGESVSDLAAMVSAVASLGSMTLCLWLPQKQEGWVSIIIYLIMVIVVGTVVYESGGFESPFIGLWALISIFAGFFGPLIILLMALLAFGQIFLDYQASSPDIMTLVGHALSVLTPLLLGFIVWHRKPEAKKDKHFSDLEHKLSSAEGKSDVVINAIDDGVLAISKAGIIELINPSAQNLIGWDQGDALGLSWQSVLKLVNSEGHELTEAENPVAQALVTNKPTHSENFSILTNSDRKRLVSIVSSPVGSDGEGIIVVFRDITKEKAEEREQAEFISTASHEMRTPVASIEGYLGLALNPATANIDEKARDFITKAHESAQHLGRLFQDLLDVSKAEDGRLKNNPKPINIEDFVRDIFSGLKPKAAEKKDLLYVFRPNPSLDEEGDTQNIRPVYYANVDPDHLREVVSNLIENAIKYTVSGEVVVDVTGDDKVVTISVRDTGVGIPAEDLPHLFQKFYRVDNSDTREIGGTGLGLYLSRRLAEDMDGGIRVESQYKKGSTFFLDIPRISHEEAERKEQELAAKASETPAPAPVAQPELAPEPTPAQPTDVPAEVEPTVAQATTPENPPAPETAPLATAGTPTAPEPAAITEQPAPEPEVPAQPIDAPVAPSPIEPTPEPQPAVSAPTATVPPTTPASTPTKIPVTINQPNPQPTQVAAQTKTTLADLESQVKVDRQQVPVPDRTNQP